MYTSLIGYWREIIIALLVAAVLTLDARIDAKTAEHDAYVARVESANEVAEQRKVAIEDRQDANLQVIEGKHDEKHVEAVRTGAVASIRRGLRKPASGGSGMPGIAARVEADDGTREECAAAFAVVADAAEDADTLSMWQEWARLNNIPVQP